MRHSNGYTTQIWHLARFAKNLKTGDVVRAGRIIGYGGQHRTGYRRLSRPRGVPSPTGIPVDPWPLLNQTGNDMTFNPRTYWPAMGPWLAGPGAVSPEHIQVEAILMDLLPSLNPIHSVLDVGCGSGRLASLLGDALPAAHYTGLDIGLAQVEATQLSS